MMVNVGKMVTERIKNITEDIYSLTKDIPGVSDTFTVYFVKGNCNIIIEPGPSTLIPSILSTADELEISEFQYIIPTHVHMDHAGASGKLASIFRQANVIANSQGARHLINPDRLMRSTRMSFGENFEDTYGSIEPVHESRIKVVRDRERLSLNGREMIFIDTPGHAPHHIAIFDIKTGGLFCGEALGLIYTPGTQPLSSGAPPNFDLEVYINTMENLRELPLEFLVYSHGGVSWQPDRSITMAIRNVRIIGEVILQALKTNTEEASARIVDKYIQEHFGARLSEYTLMNNITGYGGYFKKQGLI
ncbi:MBL fold metallo-hydrolase [Chloroflexota bacterium]